MSRSYSIEKLPGEQFKNHFVISDFGPEGIREGELVPQRAPSLPKIVYKTGSPADIPLDGAFDFVCLGGIGKFQIESAEIFDKIKQALKIGGLCCLLTASDLDSFIYYGMEAGFDFIKSEGIKTGEIMQSLIENSPAGTSALFFTFSGSELDAELISQTLTDGKKKITGVWFLRN